jgi:NIPSNAP
MTEHSACLHELRLYHLLPNTLQPYLALLVPRLDWYRSVMGPCVGHFVAQGRDDLVVTLWRYTDAQDRLTRRAALDADPQWQVFREQARPLIRKLESILLDPTPGAASVWPLTPTGAFHEDSGNLR